MSQILNLPLYNLEISTSNDADWRCAFAVTDKDDDGVQQPIDLSDIDFFLKVRRSLDGHEILLASQTGELVVSGIGLNVINMLFLVDRMRRVPVGVWPFEITATGDGATVELVNGTLTHGFSGGSVITSISSTIREIAQLPDDQTEELIEDVPV
jgi:hypothetical protein